jgi:hypothetical protein
MTFWTEVCGAESTRLRLGLQWEPAEELEAAV